LFGRLLIASGSNAFVSFDLDLQRVRATGAHLASRRAGNPANLISPTESSHFQKARACLQ
jgi:hypothetical protein